MQILVASHVAPVRHTLRVLLEKEGHKVHLAPSLEAAQAVVAANLRLDVILSEWKLDEGTAITLQRRCQEIDRMTDNGVEAGAPQFIILATPNAGSGLSEDHSISDEIQSFGFADVFEKPLNRAALIKRVRSIAAERKVAAATATAPAAAAPAARVIPPAPSPVEESPSVAPPARISAGRFVQLETEVVAIREHLEAQSQRLVALAQSLNEMTREFAESPGLGMPAMPDSAASC